MPGYVTHYIFGRDMYEKLNDPVLKNNLYKNRAVYALGHQGPDIFFYYLPAYVLHGHNLGDMAHTENTGTFYAALLESRSIFKKPEDLQIACLALPFRCCAWPSAQAPSGSTGSTAR